MSRIANQIVQSALREAAGQPPATVVWGDNGNAEFKVSPVDDDGAGLIAGTDCPWFKGLVNFTYHEPDDQIVATSPAGQELGRTKLGSPDPLFLVLVGKEVGMPLYYQPINLDGALVIGPDKLAVRARAEQLNAEISSEQSGEDLE